MSDEIMVEPAEDTNSLSDYSSVAQSPPSLGSRSHIPILPPGDSPFAEYDGMMGHEASMPVMSKSPTPVRDILKRSKPPSSVSDGESFVDADYDDEDDDSSAQESDSGPGSAKGNLWNITRNGEPPSLSKLHAARWSKDQDPCCYALSVPWRGLAFSMRHPRLWKYAVIPFLILIPFSIILFLALSYYTAESQGEFLSIVLEEDVPDDAKLTYGIYLCFLEASMISYLLSQILLDKCIRNVFDEVWLINQWTDGTSLRKTPFPRRCKELWYGLFIGSSIWLVSLPLNLIPVAGQLIYILVNAWAQAWVLQIKFLSAKRLKLSWQFRWVCSHWEVYTLVGFQLTLTSLVPILSPFVYFATIVGMSIISGELNSRPVFLQMVEETQLLVGSDKAASTAEDQFTSAIHI